MPKITKLTPALLRKMIQEEKKSIKETLETGESDPVKAAEKTEEVEAEDMANVLAKDIDHLKVLKIQETKLRSKLAKVEKAKHLLRKRVIKNIK
jgi:hypothetical protein